VSSSSPVAAPVLWDVDTQVDFVLPTGKLYVPGAEATVPAMGRLVDWARRAGIVHVASADDHEPADQEFSDTPDFVRTYPPHCLRGTPGARRVPQTEQADPVVLSRDAILQDDLVQRIGGRRELLFLKQTFDVFSNPNVDGVLDALAPSEVILFGVATDVCDDMAVMGLLRRGYRVAFVADAACGLDEARTTACLARWREHGVRFTTADEVVSGPG
jgi:nicotinamidase/pyrazinamidase